MLAGRHEPVNILFTHIRESSLLKSLLYHSQILEESQYCTSYLEQRTEIVFYSNNLIFNLVQSFNTNLPEAIIYKMWQSKFVTYDT
jgi:hypothetical protein